MPVIQPDMEHSPGNHAYSDYADNDARIRAAFDRDSRLKGLAAFGCHSLSAEDIELVNDILSGSGETAEQSVEYFRREKERNFEYDARPPYYDPLYYIMLSRRYDLAAAYFKELTADIKYTFISAVLYGEWAFIQTLFEYGYRPDSEIFAELAAYPAAFDNFRENCYGYYCPECKAAPSERKFFEYILPEIERYRFAYLIYRKFGANNANRYFERTDFPKITAVPASVLMSIRSFSPEFCYDDFDESALARLMGDDIRIIADTANVVYTVNDNSKLFCGKTQVYDIRGHEDSLTFCQTNRRIKKFLQQKIIFSKTESCSAMVRSVLCRNNRALTALVIKQGLINEKNFGDTVDYLTENHLFDVLNQVNKAAGAIFSSK